MIVYKCDKCGREMKRWLVLKVDIGAMADWVNVGDLIKHKGTRMLCEDCFGRVFTAADFFVCKDFIEGKE